MLNRIRALLAAGVFAGLLVAAGCGDSGKDAPKTNAPPNPKIQRSAKGAPGGGGVGGGGAPKPAAPLVKP